MGAAPTAAILLDWTGIAAEAAPTTAPTTASTHAKARKGTPKDPLFVLLAEWTGLTSDVLSLALRAHFVRPNSVLSSASCLTKHAGLRHPWLRRSAGQSRALAITASPQRICRTPVDQRRPVAGPAGALRASKSAPCGFVAGSIPDTEPKKRSGPLRGPDFCWRSGRDSNPRPPA